MSNVEDFFTEEEIKEIRTDALTRRKNVSCREVAEDKPELAFVGQGLSRCAFITNTKEEIVKVAKDKEGVTENKRSSNAFVVDEEIAERTFAMPKDVSDDGMVMVQEEVEVLTHEEKQELDTRAIEDQVEEKTNEVFNDSGIRCLDIVPQNIGRKNVRGKQTYVLSDLGECKEVGNIGQKVEVKTRGRS